MMGIEGEAITKEDKQIAFIKSVSTKDKYPYEVSKKEESSDMWEMMVLVAALPALERVEKMIMNKFYGTLEIKFENGVIQYYKKTIIEKE